MPLPDLEHRLPTRHVVAAMTIEQDDALEAMMQHVFNHPHQEVQIDSRRRGEGSGKIQVVVRIPQPREWCEGDAIAKPLGRSADDFTQQQAIGEERQVGPQEL